MPHIIGMIGVGKDFESIEVAVEVGRDTFTNFNKLAVRYVRNNTASSDFTDKVFRDIVSQNLPLNEDTINEYIK